MKKITQADVRGILEQKLALKDPLFRLRTYGGRINGSVVSRTFDRKGDLRRQRMIWDALDDALGPDSVKHVGMILAYTPEEWNFAEADDAPRPAKAKAR